MKKHWSTLTVACLFALVPGGFAAESAADAGLNVALQLQNTFTGVAEGAFPSVVVITNKQVSVRQPMYPNIPPEFHPFFGMPFERPQAPSRRPDGAQVPVPAGMGSGVIIRNDGYIVTNYHVIKDNAALEVKLRDGRVFDSAVSKDAVKVIGVDAETDLAVIKIGNGEIKDLPTLKFADSEKVRVGEWTIAVGAPFSLDYSVTVGVVSQKGRHDINMNTYENYIQTDASINPGNSGGPLLNIYGEMIGINDFIMTGGGMSQGNIGIGFAISSNLAEQISEDLIKHGKVVRPWLGIAMQTLTEELKQQFKVDFGVLVSQVMEGDPADKAGMKGGDVIIKIGDKEVKTAHDVQFAVLAYQPGDRIPVLVDREGARVTLEIVARRKDGSENDAADSGGGRGGDPLESMGLVLEAEGGSVRVAAVRPNSAAFAAKIMKGDVVIEVNRRLVKNLADVSDALEKTRNGLAVFYVSRRGAKFFVPVRLGD